MSESNNSSLANIWSSLESAARQRGFSQTPLIVLSEAGTVTGSILLLISTVLAVLAMTFHLHTVGWAIIPGGDLPVGDAVEIAKGFGSFTAEAASSVQSFRPNGWALSLLGTVAAAYFLQLIVCALVLALGRFRGMTTNLSTTSRWMVAPVLFLALYFTLVACVNLAYRWVADVNEGLLPFSVSAAVLCGGVGLAIVLPWALKLMRARGHRVRRQTSGDVFAICAPSMGAIFGVQVPGRAGRSEASEAQLREGDRAWGGSVERKP